MDGGGDERIGISISSSDEQDPFSCNSIDTSGNKKIYHRHTSHQIQKLEAFFKECPHPDDAQRNQLGRELNLEPRQIKFWFQNKRTQTKAQNERSDNMILRAENERIQCENLAIKEALKNVICPACGGPPFGEDQRQSNAQKLRTENAHLKEELDKISNLLSKYIGRPLPLIDSVAFNHGRPRPQPQLQWQPQLQLQSQLQPQPQLHSEKQPQAQLQPQPQLHSEKQPQAQTQPQPQRSPPPPPFNLFPSTFDAQTSYRNSASSNDQDPPNPAVSEQIAVVRTPAAHNHQQLHPLSDLERAMMSETAATAMEELLRLMQMEEPLWVKSTIDGRPVIDRDQYEKFSLRLSHFKTSSARIESSKESGVVAIDARDLFTMFQDPEKWMELFPTTVSRAKTIYAFIPRLAEERSGSLQLMYEHTHIVSPLVAPREFVVLRYCQQIEEGVWAVADVSYYLKDLQFPSSSYCWKLPSGCMIQDLSGGLSKVTWIEHVEVDDKPYTHRLYRDLMCGGSAYGAQRWVVSLDRMCQRLALSNVQSNPGRDFFSAVVAGAQGRSSMMKLGQRLVKSFSGMLSMSGKLDFPQLSEVNNTGVRVSVRQSLEPGQPAGIIVSAASSLWLPVPPPHVFCFFTDPHLRHQWDVLCHGNEVEEVIRIVCGADERNCFSVFRPYIPSESGMLILQESFIDSLGGMIVYAPIDGPSMHVAASGQDASELPILPSGFIISRDGRPNLAVAADGSSSSGCGGGGSLLTVAFQILVSGPPYSKDLNMESVATVNTLITSTMQRVKAMLNCSDID